MNIESLLPFLTAGVLVVVVIIWIVSSRRQGEQLQQLGEFAAQKGWEFTPGSGQTPLSLSGVQDGVTWRLIQNQRIIPSGDVVHQWSLEWCSDSTRLLEGNVLIVPGGSMLGDPSQLSGTAGRLAAKIIARVVDLPLHNAVVVGSDELRKKYTVFASSMEAVRPVLVGVEKMLVEWPHHTVGLNMPRIAVDAGGVTIRLDRPGARLDATEKLGSELLLERIVRLGVAAARSIKDYA